MDIELKLREMLVLRDPGSGFTDSVLLRLGDAPQAQAGEGVASLADARHSRRGRRLLIGVVLVMSAAAAMFPFVSDRFEKAAAQAATMGLSEDDAAGLSKDDASIAVAAAPLPTSPADSAGSTGANPLACIDEDVLQGLLMAPEVTFSLPGGVPAAIADLRLPPELVWLGSPRIESGATEVVQVYSVYRTVLSPDAARLVARDALTAAGWEFMEPVTAGSAGFVSASSSGTSTSDSFCREGKSLGLGGGARGGANYVVLTAAETGICSFPGQFPQVTASPVDEFFPSLQLPPDAATGLEATIHSRGTAAIPVGNQAQASFIVNATIDTVADHFAGQMVAQGWRPDARWAGASTAGSTWSRPTKDGKSVLATLDIHAYEAGRFNAMLRMMMVNQG